MKYFISKVALVTSARCGLVVAKFVPIGCNGEVDESAEAIGGLCSPAASGVTGQTLAVDGRLSVSMPAAD